MATTGMIEGAVQYRAAHRTGPQKRRLRLRLYSALVAADTLAIILAFLVANVVRFDALLHPQGLTLIAVTLPIFWALNGTNYTPEALETWYAGLFRTFLALLAALAIGLFLGFYLKAATELSRIVTVIGFFGSCTGIAVGRALLGRLCTAVLNGSATSRILIRDSVQADAPADVQIVDVNAWGLSGATWSPASRDRLARLIDGSDYVYIACQPERRSEWAAALQGSAVHSEMLIPELNSIGVIGANQLSGIPTVLVSAGSLRTRDEILKRAFDLLLVIPTIAFLAPLMLLVAILIKLDSPGSILFMQERVGRGNRLFRVFKFRSMRSDRSDADGAVSASRHDDRVTRIGRFIRATSIDELPQLFNILHGEMSFVGPRPHAVGSLAGDRLFWEIDERYHRRHVCKPGLTGLAQIRGFRGATARPEDLINRLHADLEYISGWSVFRDMTILLATVRVIVHRNAF